MKSNIDHLIVEILRDIDDYEKRSLLGMTARQFRWILIAIAISVPVMFPFRMIGLSSVGYLMTFVTALGVFLFGGFAKWHGRSYPDLVKSMINYYRVNQRLVYADPLLEEESEVNASGITQTKTDRSINKRYTEYR